MLELRCADKDPVVSGENQYLSASLAFVNRALTSKRLLIRGMTEEDVPLVDEVIGRFWKVAVDHRAELKGGASVCLVAEVPGKAGREIIGVAVLALSKWNKIGNLLELTVARERQRTGIGGLLVRELGSRARAAGLRAIVAETQPDNVVAVSFYRKVGFRFCGYNDRYYTNAPRSEHEVAVFYCLEV